MAEARLNYLLVEPAGRVCHIHVRISPCITLSLVSSFQFNVHVYTEEGRPEEKGCPQEEEGELRTCIDYLYRLLCSAGSLLNSHVLTDFSTVILFLVQAAPKKKKTAPKKVRGFSV